MSTRRPLNLGQRQTTIGAYQPVPQNPIGGPKLDATQYSNPRAEALAEVLGSDVMRPTGSGTIAEALARGGEAFFRTRGAVQSGEREASRYATALSAQQEEQWGENQDRKLNADYRTQGLDLQRTELTQDEAQSARSDETTRRGQDLDLMASRSRASSVPSLSEQTIDYAAQQYMLTGRLPPGMTRNTRIISQVMERVAQVAGEAGQSAGDVAFQGANYEANSGGLRSLQRQRTLVQSFERTALSNLELAQRYSEQVPRTDYPAVNRAIMEGQIQSGNSVTAQYINAVIGARAEYAKVLSGATGAAGLTDSARAEAEEMFSTAASPATFRALVQTAREEMHNRIVAFDAQEEYLRQRMTGQGIDPHAQTLPVIRGRHSGRGRASAPQRPDDVPEFEWDSMTDQERALWQ